MLSHLKPGESINKLDIKYMNDKMKSIKEQGKSFGFHAPRRLKYDDPSPVIYGGRLVHTVKNRVLTVREELRLMPAPDDFIVKTKRSQMSVEVGKGVPCNVAEYVAKNILDHINAEQHTYNGNRGHSHLVDYNGFAKGLLKLHKESNNGKQGVLSGLFS